MKRYRTMGRFAPGARGFSTRELREADLFYADLVGRPFRIPRPGEGESEQQAPAPCPPPKGSACAYFFKDSRYLRYSIANDRVDVSPVQVSGSWRLPAEFHSNLDAAVNWGDGHAYLFKGARYVRYNIATDRVDVGPTEISRFWTRLPAEFQSNLSAAVNWGDGHAYFFKGPRYLRYNVATDMVDVGPTEISRFWTRLPAEFHSNLDSVVNWGDGHAYFFKGARYLRYDIATDMPDVGPTEISRFWTALPADFQSGIKAAINWTFPCDVAALMRTAGLTVNESANWQTRSAGCFTPVGIVMHHTVGVGPNALADIVRHVKANFFVDRAGAMTVVAGGRSNHAGKGAQEVLDEVARGTAPAGTAGARRLADRIFGNGHFYGFENENKGDGVQPWPEVQLDAMARGAAALCQLHCWNANRVIAHAEWTSRKVDPRGIDMNAFRARVASHF